MREILFRGKGAFSCTNIWHEGGIALYDNTFPVIIRYTVRGEIARFMVTSETLGQFTGFTDKNGRRIWEDDILRFMTDDGTPALYRVVWDALNGAWACKYLDGNGQFPVAGFCELTEVVGNVHDNPELLNGTES